MYDLATIKKMNDEATKNAENENLAVYVAKTNRDIGVRGCPKLGDFVPKGWTLVDTYFVDSSGFGQEGEGALTFGQFLKKVKRGFGYGLGECGQFQVHINEYKKT